MNFIYTKRGIPTRIATWVREFWVDVLLTIAIVCAALVLGGCGHYRVTGAFEYNSDKAGAVTTPVVVKSAPAASGVL